jgi:hypothetical protein
VGARFGELLQGLHKMTSIWPKRKFNVPGVKSYHFMWWSQSWTTTNKTQIGWCKPSPNSRSILVGGWPTPLKNMKVNGKDGIPYINTYYIKIWKIKNVWNHRNQIFFTSFNWANHGFSKVFGSRDFDHIPPATWTTWSGPHGHYLGPLRVAHPHSYINQL